MIYLLVSIKNNFKLINNDLLNQIALTGVDQNNITIYIKKLLIYLIVKIKFSVY